MEQTAFRAGRAKLDPMARGFDSKFVEAQQEEATREKTIRPAMTSEERARETKRLALEMSLARARDDLRRATASGHRLMLEQAIKALDDQLASLG